MSPGDNHSQVQMVPEAPALLPPTALRTPSLVLAQGPMSHSSGRWLQAQLRTEHQIKKRGVLVGLCVLCQNSCFCLKYCRKISHLRRQQTRKAAVRAKGAASCQLWRPRSHRGCVTKAGAQEWGGTGQSPPTWRISGSHQQSPTGTHSACCTAETAQAWGFLGQLWTLQLSQQSHAHHSAGTVCGHAAGPSPGAPALSLQQWARAAAAFLPGTTRTR